MTNACHNAKMIKSFRFIALFSTHAPSLIINSLFRQFLVRNVGLRTTVVGAINIPSHPTSTTIHSPTICCDTALTASTRLIPGTACGAGASPVCYGSGGSAAPACMVADSLSGVAFWRGCGARCWCDGGATGRRCGATGRGGGFRPGAVGVGGCGAVGRATRG